MDKNICSPSFFSVLPAFVRYDLELTASEKVLYSEISALTSLKGYCFANNNYFSKLFNISSRTISNWLNHLKNKKYITIEYDIYNNRKIYIFNDVKNIMSESLPNNYINVLKEFYSNIK